MGTPAEPDASRGRAPLAPHLLCHSAVYLHILRFQTQDQMAWALRRLMDASEVEDCIAARDELEIRVCARGQGVGKLVEHLYERGGLTWATRHPLRRPPRA